MNELLTKKDLMKVFNKVSLSTINRWMKKGMPFIKIDKARTGSVRFNAEKVEEWLYEDNQ